MRRSRLGSCAACRAGDTLGAPFDALTFGAGAFATVVDS
jgi:hypothetical protein